MTKKIGWTTRGIGAVLAGAMTMALSTTAFAEQVNLRWGVWAGNPEEAEIWQQIADLVHEKNPDITITLETAPWGPYWDKLTTQLASRTAPDIISLHHMFYANYADNGLLMDIGPLIEASPEIDYDDFYGPAQEGLSDGDTVYAMTYGIAPYFIYYNRVLFDRAGEPYPSSETPMTFEEFSALAKRLTDKDAGIYGFNMDPNFNAILPFIWSAGGDYLNEDGSASEFGSDATRKALEVIFDLYAEDGGAKPIVDLTGGTTADDFADGKVAMMSNGSWMIGYINSRSNAGLDWDMAPVPAGDAGSVTWSGVSGFAPSLASEHQDEAWEAIKIITGVEAQTIIGASGREFPSRVSVVDAWLNSDVAPEHGEMVPMLLAAEGEAVARPLKGGVTWAQMNQLFGRELGAGFLGNADANQIADRVDDGLNEIILDSQ